MIPEDDVIPENDVIPEDDAIPEDEVISEDVELEENVEVADGKISQRKVKCLQRSLMTNMTKCPPETDM